MLNRRHIRIKVMQIIYSFKGTESDDLMRYDRFLLKSIDSMLDLYFVLMSLMIKYINKRNLLLINLNKSIWLRKKTRIPIENF